MIEGDARSLDYSPCGGSEPTQFFLGSNDISEEADALLLKTPAEDRAVGSHLGWQKPGHVEIAEMLCCIYAGV